MEKSWLKLEIKKLKRKLKNQSKYNDNIYLWIGFFIFGFILFVNVLIMLMFLSDSQYQYRIINHAYIQAVLPEQEINSTLQLGIVRIKELKLDELQIGDSVLVYEDFNLDVYWVEEITSIDLSANEVVLTYDSLNHTTYDIDDIVGVYENDANFFGTVYYSASFIKGFVYLTISHVFLIVGYFYIFIVKKEETE